MEHATNIDEKQISFGNKIDEIRKKKILEYARECLKVLCKYKKLFVNNGISIGVQDFNLNDDRLIIQYTESSAYETNDEIKIKSNLIKLNKSIIEDQDKLTIFNEKKFSDFIKIDEDMGFVKDDDGILSYDLNFDEYETYLNYQKYVDKNKILENGNCLVKNNSQIFIRFKDNYKFDDKIISDKTYQKFR